MKIKILASTVSALSLLLLVPGGGASAQADKPMHLSGLINDYTPATVKGGPYEMHGQWKLDFLAEGFKVPGLPVKADFSVDMTMSDYGTTNGLPDATKGGQNPHTHHIRLTNATVTWTTNGCPTVSPATLTGFQINGPVSLITGNGSNAAFETNPPSTTLQVCITGGDPIPYSVLNSNVSLVFVGPATMHFGPQAIHGVVKNATVEPTPKN